MLLSLLLLNLKPIHHVEVSEIIETDIYNNSRRLKHLFIVCFKSCADGKR